MTKSGPNEKKGGNEANQHSCLVKAYIIHPFKTDTEKWLGLRILKISHFVLRRCFTFTYELKTNLIYSCPKCSVEFVVKGAFPLKCSDGIQVSTAPIPLEEDSPDSSLDYV